jgi:hypothetical protein
MVQNQLNQPGIDKNQFGLSSARVRSRVGSQPIKPLKLPTFPQPDRQENSVQAVHADTAAKLNTASSLASTTESEPQPPEPNGEELPTGSKNPPAPKRGSSTTHKTGLKTKALPKNSPVAKLRRKAAAVDLTRKLAAAQQTAGKTAQKLSNTATTTYRSLLPPLDRSLSWLNRRKQSLQWLVIWLSILGSFGGITGLAFVWLASPPPSADCRKVTSESMSAQRLYCAQELARSGKLADLAAGIALLENWPTQAPLYNDAQEEITEWSRLILVIAQGQMAQGKLKEAIEAVSQIPASSSVYLEAQELVTAWRQEWQKGEAVVAVAQEAIKAQNWKLASQQVGELGYFDREYWRLERADVLFKQIVREKQARQNLTQAQKLGKHQRLEQLSEAIGLLRQVPDNTYASEEAQKLLQAWSQTLITAALEQWQAGDREGALATAVKIPLAPSLPAAGLDLIRLSQANQLVADKLQPEAAMLNVKEMWALLEAVAAVRQIKSDSPFYEEAQAVQQTWQAHLQDLTQLGFANMIAHGGDRAALEFAVAQASQIQENRPRYAQSQALMAQWQRDIQGLEDLPYLALGQRWAASGKVPDLRTAIAQVRQIPDDRAAWHKAQELITTWTAQIQTIEDQPTWNQAQKLAKQGKLSEAIEMASRIQPNRALHSEAQTGIETWKAKLQAAEVAADRPILDRAYSLAATERLTMAIDLASQIAPGRALYSEAQAAIEAWSDQRDDIWKGWSESPPTNNELETDAETEAPTTDLATESSASESSEAEAPESEVPADAAVAASDSSNSMEGYYNEGYAGSSQSH